MEQERGSKRFSLLVFFHDFFFFFFLFQSMWAGRRESTNLFMEDPFYGHVTLNWKSLRDWLSVSFAVFDRWWLRAHKLSCCFSLAPLLGVK